MKAIGERVGRFVIEAHLGSGGMGEVYLAHDPDLDRQVALKLVRPREDTSAIDGHARLLREARAAAALTHPNVVTVYEVGQVDDATFIAMEHIRGRTLREALGDSSVGLEERLSWLAVVARALRAAHDAGLVHRDIKPENVIIARDGTVKVLDFGIARRDAPLDASSPTEDSSLAVATTATAPGAVMGTPAYMAPEQIRGELVDGRADQFAWAVVAYEVLAGRVPWSTARGALATVASILSEEPPPLEATVPVRVAETIARALAKDRAQRFPTMKELIAAFEGEAPAPARAGSTSTISGRGRRTLATVALGALALGAVLVVMRFRSSGGAVGSEASDDARPVSTVPKANAAFVAGVQAFKDGATNDALARWEEATSLDPSLATAFMRMAFLRSFYDPPAARRDYQKARELRSLLRPAERDLLEAMEPRILRDPFDIAEAGRRLEQVAATYPSDPLVQFAFAATLRDLERNDEALAVFARVRGLDPSFSRVLWIEGEMRAYAGDFAAASALCDQALAKTPGATTAHVIRATIQMQEGRCSEIVEEAQRWSSASPTDPDAWELRAIGLASTGAPALAIEAALAQRWAALPPASRAAVSASDRMRMAMMFGDFARAGEEARALERAVQGSSTEADRAEPALALAELALEAGRDQEARRVAESFLANRGSWTPHPATDDYGMLFDPVPEALSVLRRAGEARAAMSPRRDEWLARWQARHPPSGARGNLWTWAHALSSWDEADAREALDALPRLGPVPPFRPLAFVEGDIGRVYRLAGRPDEAAPWLLRATRSCNVLHYPIEHTRSFVELGLALEAKRDTPGACAAYGAALARWGNAKPPPRTAEHARRLSKALGCR